MRHILLSLISFLLIQNAVQAQTDIFVRGSGQAFPVALPRLCLESGEGTAASDIPRVIGKDLQISGFFDVLAPEGYIEAPGKCIPQDQTVYSDWSVIRAEGLVKGVVSSVGSGNIRVQLYLHDVAKQKVVLAKEYQGDSSLAGKMAHKFANEVLYYFTGEPGVFDTEIAFSSKVGRFKEIFTMDMNGDNIRQLTNFRSLSVGASWNPEANKLVFTSYKNRQPDIFTLDPRTRAITPITNSQLLEVAPAFTRDGQAVITSVSNGSSSDLVLMSLQGQVLKRLTRSDGTINVSPSFSPDHSQVAFCSNRAGNPQIYVMNADGSDVRRISFATSSYCTSPAWSPKGDRIAFVCRADGGFQLFTTDPFGNGTLQLTSNRDNEDPSWSPDGRYIAFSTTHTRGGQPAIAIIRKDGANMVQITSGRVGDSEPAWSPKGN